MTTPLRSGRFRLVLATIAVGTLVSLALYGCSASSSSSPSPAASSAPSSAATAAATTAASAAPASAAPATGKTVAFVSTSKAGDRGPVDDMIAALKRVETDFGAKTKYIEVTDSSAMESTLRTLGQAKTDIVVTTFGPMQQPIQNVAKDFPDTRFILIFGDPYTPTIPNVQTVGYDIPQAMYVAGVLAASVSASGSIGWIGGAAIPTLNANYHAYAAGAKSVNPNIKVQGAFAGSFEDPAKGQSLGAAMVASGIDVIQTDAAATSLGVIKAAANGKAFTILDSSGETAAEYPTSVLGVTFLKFGDSLYAQVKAALADGWQGGAVHSGLDEGIVGLTLSDAFLKGTSPLAPKVTALQSQLDQVVSGIKDGSIKVPFDTSGI